MTTVATQGEEAVAAREAAFFGANKEVTRTPTVLDSLLNASAMAVVVVVVAAEVQTKQTKARARERERERERQRKRACVFVCVSERAFCFLLFSFAADQESRGLQEDAKPVATVLCEYQNKHILLLF
jgi:hypothetical protein